MDRTTTQFSKVLVSETPDGVRPDSPTWQVVLSFAVLIEQQLEKNRHKDRYDNGALDHRSWLKDDARELLEHALEEFQEVDEALASLQHRITRPKDGEERVQQEAADAAAMMMMVADRVKQLEPVRWIIAGKIPAINGKRYEVHARGTISVVPHPDGQGKWRAICEAGDSGAGVAATVISNSPSRDDALDEAIVHKVTYPSCSYSEVTAKFAGMSRGSRDEDGATRKRVVTTQAGTLCWEVSCTLHGVFWDYLATEEDADRMLGIHQEKEGCRPVGA